MKILLGLTQCQCTYSYLIIFIVDSLIFSTGKAQRSTFKACSGFTGDLRGLPISLFHAITFIGKHDSSILCMCCSYRVLFAVVPPSVVPPYAIFGMRSRRVRPLTFSHKILRSSKKIFDVSKFVIRSAFQVCRYHHYPAENPHSFLHPIKLLPRLVLISFPDIF